MHAASTTTIVLTESSTLTMAKITYISIEQQLTLESPRSVSAISEFLHSNHESSSSLGSTSTPLSSATKRKQYQQNLRQRLAVPYFDDQSLTSTVAANNVSSTRPKKVVKKVRFAKQVSVTNNNTHVLTTRMISKLWWTPDQLDQILDNARAISSFYLSERPYFQRGLSILLHDSLTPQFNKRKTLDNVTSVICTFPSARGLEQATLENLQHARHDVQTAFFRVQRDTKHWKSSAKRANTLAIKYHQSSRYATRFAYIMGQLDAKWAMSDRNYIEV